MARWPAAARSPAGRRVLSRGRDSGLPAERFPAVVDVAEPLRGPAAAHNRGLPEARGGLVASTDDGVIVDCRWRLELARSFAAADDLVCVTGLIFPDELETPAQVWLEDCVGLNKGHRRRLLDTGRRAVSTLAGARDGLSSERSFLARTLPAELARGSGEAAPRRDRAELQRAAAVVAGLAVTTAGYVAGRARAVPAPRPVEPVMGEAAP